MTDGVDVARITLQYPFATMARTAYFLLMILASIREDECLPSMSFTISELLAAVVSHDQGNLMTTSAAPPTWS